ncbi:hypothetical protein DNL40_03155 [Xylanimonas oleitrophica]|uniref:SH3 domain-containing protein n=1 Tax=Xylanimonas oleitrophica TaxID=2607479 RepID=A0A2W5X359_9MICO|nr:SH3 domain-containing protein [Xylanimonas oleitrophica]PZR55376.1 hypothetical protein DNL40_03155 [Xylanimonas oleitrophica]
MRTPENTAPAASRRRRGLGIVAGLATMLTTTTIALAAPAAADDDGQTHRVYATREGLVGKTTANGHTITERDHFVALPSTRVLSAHGTGTYSVRVCTAGAHRCAYAPVWDVGPWNTRDDYWSTTRHWAQDLPVGTPQASAAFRQGHSGGKDQYGRQVANPAGIDLADGTFWDGLGLQDNAWVDVTFLWQGGARTGTVVSPDQPLNVRTGPGTGYRPTGLAAHTAQVPLLCHARGTLVTGSRGTTDLWYRIGEKNWVSDAYLRTGTGAAVAPPC